MNGWAFIMFGIISGLGIVYLLVFMKETKGLSSAQLKRLYRKDMNDVDYGMSETL